MWFFLYFSRQGGCSISAFSFSQGSDCLGGCFEMSGLFHPVTQSLSLNKSSYGIMLTTQKQNLTSCLLSSGSGVRVCGRWEAGKDRRMRPTRSQQLAVLPFRSS